MDWSTGTWIAVVAIIIGLLFALREFYCWYWKINDIRNLLQKILERLPADTELTVENKIVKQVSSNEPVGMKRVGFGNKKNEFTVEDEPNTSDHIPSDTSEEADIEGMVVCKACGKMKKPQGMCPHCGSWRK